MAIYCDACEHELGPEVSECCQADVWRELRAHSTIDFCQECGKICMVVEEWDKERD